MNPQAELISRATFPLVYAVVLNWNGGEMNRTCLDALLSCGYPNLKVLFVDNGSTDGSPEEVREQYQDVELLINTENLGFTGGNNRGIRRALDLGAEMVLILNNDVEVPKGFLEPLVDHLREKSGVAGPKIIASGGRIWCAGGKLAFHHNVTLLRGYGQEDNGRYDQEEQVDYLPACCLLISKEVLDRVGLLDDDYFCYLEDVDFCFRARKLGYGVTYCPDSRIIHHFSWSTGGGYTPARKYMNGLNSIRFLKKHGTVSSWIAFWCLDVLALPLVFVVRLFQGQTAGLIAKARGIFAGLRGDKITKETVERFIRKEGRE